ncbi:MAG: MFS transporter [Chloroflexota bacterium]
MLQNSRLKSTYRSVLDVFTPLTIPNYQRMFSSNSIWWMTIFMELVAMGWLVLELTDSAWLVSVVGFFRTIPLIFFGFVAGPIIDRFGRRRIIIIAIIVDLCSYSVLTLLLWLNQLEVWHLYIIALALGSMWGTQWPARRGFLPDLVGKERTVDVLLIERVGQGTARIIGPTLAGILVNQYGMVGCFTVMALVQVINLGSLWAVTVKGETEASNEDESKKSTPFQQIKEGVAYARRSPVVMGILVATIITNLLIFPYMTLLPVFARDVLNQNEIGLGWLGSASGIGSFVGLLIITSWRRIGGRFGNNGTIFTTGTFLLCVVICVFALSPVYWVSWVALLFAGITQSCFGIMQSGIMMLVVDDAMRSRMMGLIVICIGMDPFGKLIIGALAEWYGAPLALGLTSGIAMVLILWLTAGIPQLRRI